MMAEQFGPLSRGPSIRVLADGTIVYVDAVFDPARPPRPDPRPWVWTPDALRSGLARASAVNTGGER